MLRIYRALILAAFFVGIPPQCSWASFGEEIKIGVVLPLSGNAARYGQYIKEGLELARDELKDSINIRLIYEDDECNGVKGVAATRKLITFDHVRAIYGSWCSSVVLAQAPIVNQAHVVLMATAISPQIRAAGDFVYDIQPSARGYLDAALPQALREARTWGIFSIMNDFGFDLAQYFAEQIEQQGGQVLSREEYLPSTTDFRVQILKIKQAHPEGVFLAGYSEAGLLLKQMRENGLKVFTLTPPTFENPDILTVAGEAAEGVYFPHHYDPASTLTSVQNYEHRYQEKYGHSSEGFAMLAYEGLSILAETLRDCRVNVECVQHALNTKEFPGVMGPVKFDGSGEAVRHFVVKTVRQNKFVTVE